MQTRRDNGQVDDYVHGRVPRAVREEQVLILAEKLFAERGYEGLKMDELARRAGISKPVVYDLVGSKDEIYRRCFERAASELAEAAGTAAAARVGDLREMVLASSAAFFRFIQWHRGAWAMLFAENAGGRHAEHVARIRARQARLMTRMLKESASAAGVDVDPRRVEAAAYAFVGAAEALAHWWRANEDVPAEALADWLVGTTMPRLELLTTPAAGER